MSDICSSCTVVVLYVIIPCYTRHPFIGILGCCIFVNEIRPWVKCNNYRQNNFSPCNEIQFYLFLCNHCSPSYYNYASNLTIYTVIIDTKPWYISMPCRILNHLLPLKIGVYVASDWKHFLLPAGNVTLSLFPGLCQAQWLVGFSLCESQLFCLRIGWY